MFDEPKYGWCRFTPTDDIEFFISDITNMFPVWLEQIEFGLKTRTPICLYMDGEDKESYLILDFFDAFFIEIDEETNIKQLDLSIKTFVSILKEDINKHLSSWKRWGCCDDADPDNEFDFTKIDKLLEKEV